MLEVCFEGWFPSRYNCFAISNIGSDDAFEVSKESFSNPPIKVLFPDCSDNDLAKFCDATENPDNPPDFKKDLIQILRGISSVWRLTGVSIDVIGGISLCYAARSQAVLSKNAGVYSIGHVIVDTFNLRLLQLPTKLVFEKAYINTLYIESYRINAEASINEIGRDLNIQITKFAWKQKIYDLEMHEDNHGLEAYGDKQYYIGKLYL